MKQRQVEQENLERDLARSEQERNEFEATVSAAVGECLSVESLEPNDSVSGIISFRIPRLADLIAANKKAQTQASNASVKASTVEFPDKPVLIYRLSYKTDEGSADFYFSLRK